DEEWFTMHITVRGKTIESRINGLLVSEYTEPTPPVIPPGNETGRFLDHGTFALQCHDPGSKALYRRIRVRPLADDLKTPGTPPVVDDLFRTIVNTGRDNVPMVDFDVH